MNTRSHAHLTTALLTLTLTTLTTAWLTAPDAQAQARELRRLRKLPPKANVRPAPTPKPRTLHVVVYSTSTVPKAECRVFGRSSSKPKKVTLLKTIKHQRKGNREEHYTVSVPGSMDTVDVSCRAPGQRYAKVTQDLRTQDPNRVGPKASCGSSQPDAMCTLSVIGHDYGR